MHKKGDKSSFHSN